MRKYCIQILLFCLLFTTKTFSQTTIKKDPEIEEMVNEVSIDSLHSYITKLVSFGTRNTLSSLKEKQRGIGAAREWVLEKFRQFSKNSDGRMTAFLDTTTIAADGKRVDAPTHLGNAMALLKGTDTNDDRIYIISGHLDSRVSDVMNRVSDAPGANDDGSGTSAVIECARIMSKHSFAATVIFVVVSGEEQGLLGSEFLANKAKTKNWNIDAMLNNDIMGSNNSNETLIIDNTKVRVFSEGLPNYDLDKKAKIIRSLGMENDGKARQLARYVKEIGERYVDNLEVVMVYRNDRFLRGGDHLPFVQNGFAAVRITEMNENFNHQHQDLRNQNNIEYGDLTKFIDFEYLRKNTAINVATLSNLAKASSEPINVIIDVKDLSNKTSISWSTPKSGKVKGYFILMRETTSPVWQKKIFTSGNKIVLPYSKDNYFFAVQTVNENGNESLPVIPEISH